MANCHSTLSLTCETRMDGLDPCDDEDEFVDIIEYNGKCTTLRQVDWVTRLISYWQGRARQDKSPCYDLIGHHTFVLVEPARQISLGRVLQGSSAGVTQAPLRASTPEHRRCCHGPQPVPLECRTGTQGWGERHCHMNKLVSMNQLMSDSCHCLWITVDSLWHWNETGAALDWCQLYFWGKYLFS